MELDALINRFRIESRELFNHYFRVEEPYANLDAWRILWLKTKLALRVKSEKLTPIHPPYDHQHQ